jgi:hypothetical protein
MVSEMVMEGAGVVVDTQMVNLLASLPPSDGNSLGVMLQNRMPSMILDFIFGEDQHGTDLHDRTPGDMLSCEDASS